MLKQYIVRYVHAHVRTRRTELEYSVTPTCIVVMNCCISELPCAIGPTYCSFYRLLRAQAQLEALFLDSHACCQNELLYSSTPVRSALDIVLYCSCRLLHAQEQQQVMRTTRLGFGKNAIPALGVNNGTQRKS